MKIHVSRTFFNLQSRHEYMVHGYAQCLKGNNSKRRQTRIKVHVYCMSSHSALHLCEVL